jgi:hypothetical protein
MCRHLGGRVGSGKDELTVYGGSKTMDVEDRSAVLRSLITNAWPPTRVNQRSDASGRGSPMASPDPGRTKAVVTPPATESA